MPLYRWNADNLEPVPPTTFEAEQLMERGDLQRLLRDKPDALEAGLFIVAEEYGNWQDSGRSIDLLALDNQNRLVVIELKRTQSGDHSELQAIRYAAMVSNMTLDQVIDAHRDYLAKRGIDDDARDQVLSYLGAADESDAEIHTERPRIILASAGFSTELTTSVLWLRDGGMDISCVKLQLYSNGDALLMDTNQVIPLPEASDYLVKIREKVEVERQQQRSRQSARIPGADAFLDTIDQVGKDFRPMFDKIYEWAVSLEQENLADLETGGKSGGPRSTLRANLPDTKVYLTFTWRLQSTIRFDLNAEEIHARAPKAHARIEEILGTDTYNAEKWANLKSAPSNDLMAALTDAYREANGLPPATTPPPDTAPHTPAAAP